MLRYECECTWNSSMGYGTILTTYHLPLTTYHLILTTYYLELLDEVWREAEQSGEVARREGEGLP